MATVTEELAPAERREKATARLEETRAQLADLDQQLAQNTAKRQQLDAALTDALSTVERARQKLGAASSHLTRAKAAQMVDAASAAPRVAAAEAEVAEAQSALAAAQEAAQKAGTKHAGQGKSLEARRAELVAQRMALADMATALEAHAQEAHDAHGMRQLAALAAEKQELLQCITAAQAELSASRAALDALHQSALPALLAEHDGLASVAAASGVSASPTGEAEQLLCAYLAYLDALERFGTRWKAGSSYRLPAYLVTPAGYGLTVENALIGHTATISALRKPAADALTRLRGEQGGKN
jgi:chromosome segregation ATPase